MDLFNGRASSSASCGEKLFGQVVGHVGDLRMQGRVVRCKMRHHVKRRGLGEGRRIRSSSGSNVMHNHRSLPWFI